MSELSKDEVRNPESLKMNESGSLNLIKSIILNKLKEEEFDVKRIVLFGSRAKAEHDEYSDWDILVVVDKHVSFSQKRKIASKIRKTLARKGIAIDIIIKSEDEVEAERNDVGHITYYALRDGAEL